MTTYEYKVVMIGSVSVGKTAIANRLQFKRFDEEYQPTVGAGYIPYRTTYDGKDIELQIWDTAGMERYKSLGSIYYRDANAAIIVYDQTSNESAESLESWLENFRQTVKTPCYIAIAGNKEDLPNKVVPPEKIKDWASQNGFDFYITSAKDGTGVNEMFNAMVKYLVKSNKEEATKGPALRKTKKSGGCC
ncbi:small GTP-binding protein, putative [Trichomonas vaginalis G3]|uniref:Small GTP-binding protein, putative n=1 Tax=Trichomonas vaginalis (strain ATCC PRA-98 / G3) TaxID=412133 RepID=A2EKN4_TRIV3|nr:GTPase protein [Trichomonas vaginalis G3]EAY06773.1 small GTP-binding protein, putative [Trichomonas vaginalis G3]KAI5485866.1 GTPase protein [Trichomonas vaginalis G3]|eukprot:XP_001318996.1 small GTP-binding protein [Trichomonas vaginalis G3]